MKKFTWISGQPHHYASLGEVGDPASQCSEPPAGSLDHNRGKCRDRHSTKNAKGTPASPPVPLPMMSIHPTTKGMCRLGEGELINSLTKLQKTWIPLYCSNKQDTLQTFFSCHWKNNSEKRSEKLSSLGAPMSWQRGEWSSLDQFGVSKAKSLRKGGCDPR